MRVCVAARVRGAMAVALLVGAFVGGIGALRAHNLASYYSEPQRVACGGRFDPYAMTAAHPSLPCGTTVRVTSLRDGKSVLVTINDRGPYVPGRIIDLSYAAAKRLDMIGAGLIPVMIEVVK